MIKKYCKKEAQLRMDFRKVLQLYLLLKQEKSEHLEGFIEC